MRTANYYIKRCSMSLIIEEMQIGTPMIPHLAQVRVVAIETQDMMSVGRLWGHRSALVAGREMELPPWRTAWRLLTELRLEMPYDPAIPQFHLQMYVRI